MNTVQRALSSSALATVAESVAIKGRLADPFAHVTQEDDGYVVQIRTLLNYGQRGVRNYRFRRIRVGRWLPTKQPGFACDGIASCSKFARMTWPEHTTLKAYAAQASTVWSTTHQIGFQLISRNN
jgi:hypothetical protein